MLKTEIKARSVLEIKIQELEQESKSLQHTELKSLKEEIASKDGRIVKLN